MIWSAMEICPVAVRRIFSGSIWMLLALPLSVGISMLRSDSRGSSVEVTRK
jgi:hypothetical protein